MSARSSSSQPNNRKNENLRQRAQVTPISDDDQPVTKPTSDDTFDDVRSSRRSDRRRSSSPGTPNIALIVLITLFFAFQLFFTYLTYQQVAVFSPHAHSLLTTLDSIQHSFDHFQSSIDSLQATSDSTQTSIEQIHHELESITQELKEIKERGGLAASADSTTTSSDIDSSSIISGDSSIDSSADSSSDDASADKTESEEDTTEDNTPTPVEPLPPLDPERYGALLNGTQTLLLSEQELALLQSQRAIGPTNKTAAFMKWINQNLLQGDQPENLESHHSIQLIEETVDSRYVTSTRAISRGEYFLKIPRANMLSILTVRQSLVGDIMNKAGDNPKYENLTNVLWNKNVWITAFLLYEKQDEHSYWKPYLDIVPHDYSHMPVFFNDSQLLSLLGTLTLENIRIEQRDYIREYTELIQIEELGFSQFSLAEFMWARCVVGSRVFGAEGLDPENPDDSIHSMVPLADLLNHESMERKVDAMWGYNKRTQEFAFIALKNIASNAPMFTSYGHRGNLELFSNYGFSIEENPYSEAAVCVGVGMKDARHKEKIQLLHRVFSHNEENFELRCGHRNGWAGSSATEEAIYRCRIMMDIDDESTHECLTFLRIAAANDAALLPLILDAPSHDQLRQIPPISFENEVEAMLMFGGSCRVALTDFIGGTVAQEREKLRLDAEHRKMGLDHMTWNERNMVIVRTSEKDILELYVYIADRVANFTEHLPETEREALEWLDASQPHVSRFYFTNIFLPLYYTRKNWTFPDIKKVRTYSDIMSEKPKEDRNVRSEINY